MARRIKGTTAVVTGASSGIGRSSAGAISAGVGLAIGGAALATGLLLFARSSARSRRS